MKTLSLVTHDGKMHADDVISCAILLLAIQEAYPGYCVNIIRSRNSVNWGKADILFDVGEEYNPSKCKFDHHQKNAPYRPNGLPYAAAGLIWKHFGKILCEDEQWELIDKEIELVDCADNGIGTQENCVAALFDPFNPTLLEDQQPDKAFDLAVATAKDCLLEVLYSGRPLYDSLSDHPLIHRRKHIHMNASLKGEEIVKSVLGKAQRENKPIAILPNPALPWVKQIHRYPSIKFVIFPSGTGKYMIQSVPSKDNHMQPEYPFPEAWVENIVQSGVKDATFCHKARFIAGAATLEGCLNLALVSGFTTAEETNQTLT